MKKLFKTISVFLASVLLCSVVGCAVERAPKLPKLATPTVSIDDYGMATWDSVDNAIYYIYVIDEGEEKLTDDCHVQLAHNESVKVKAVSGSEKYTDSEFSRYVTYNKKVVQPTKLGTPQVSVNAAGLAAWNVVDNAQYYIYVIDGGAEQRTTTRSVTLSDGQTFKVKACSDDEQYENGDFSPLKTYSNGFVVTALAVPRVSISSDGVATWYEVANAQFYLYVIDGGAEQRTTARSVTLSDGQSIKVMACNEGNEYTDSDFSSPQTYTAVIVPTKLGTPTVSVGANGVASWNAVANAQYYIYKINDGAETRTTGLSVTLANNQTFTVKACNDDENYTDGDYSQVVTYTDSRPPVPHTHTDANSDGKCDTCSKSVMSELTFLAVNDLHGKFMDTDSQPGVDEFTTYLKNLYSDDAREEILLSSGDMWQGTVESSSNKGRLMTEWMNEVGFVSMTLGNHEYDWGPAVLTPNSKLAEFPFLAINVTYNGKATDYCQPSVMVEKGGIKIGIIGAIGDCLSSISGDYQTGLKFATGSELTSMVKAESDRLRSEEGCDFIVYSIHDGYDGSASVSSVTNVTNSDMTYYDTSLSNGYVDLVFEGHTHKGYILKDEYGVYHLQGGGENRYISHADVTYNTVTKEYTVTPKIVGKATYANSSFKDDPIVNTLFDKYFPDGNPYTTVLGANSSQKESAEICDDVAKLYYEKGVDLWGSQYNIVLGGGFLRLRSPYYVSAGNVTYASLFSVLPFDNDIVLGKIKGTYLKSKFINSTNSDYHVYSIISASSVNDDSDYYIIVDSYTSTYTSNRITEVKRWNSGKYARDLLADYVKSGGWA